MNRDHFLFGVVIGVILPLIAYLLTTYTGLQQTVADGKPAALYLLAGLGNLLLLRYFYKNGQELTAKGMMLTTFIGIITLVYTLKILGS
jgi:heme/copper-type cytochrome/quinol oxidase subunit 4